MQKEIKNYKLTSSGPESLSDDSDAAAAFFFGMIQTIFFPFFNNKKKNQQPKFGLTSQFIHDTV